MRHYSYKLRAFHFFFVRFAYPNYPSSIQLEILTQIPNINLTVELFTLSDIIHTVGNINSPPPPRRLFRWRSPTLHRLLLGFVEQHLKRGGRPSPHRPLLYPLSCFRVGRPAYSAERGGKPKKKKKVRFED